MAAAQLPDKSCSDDELAEWRDAVQATLVANWRVPYEDRYLACTVMLSLNWRGEVLNVGIANCGEDPEVHRSVVNAGYQASPIRMPENRACLQRNVIIRLESRPLNPGEQEDSVDPE
jgi:hypothetical protein